MQPKQYLALLLASVLTAATAEPQQGALIDQAFIEQILGTDEIVQQPNNRGKYSCFTLPRVDLSLSLPLPGVISRIPVAEGQRVAKGDLLLQLDDRIAELEYRRLRRIADSNHMIDAQKSRIENAKKLLDTARKLAKSTRSISTEELDKLEFEYQQKRYEMQKLQHEKQIDLLAAEREQLELQRRRLLAPISGTVVRIHFDEGATIQANQTLLRMVDTTTGIMQCSLEVSASANITQGQEYPIEFAGAIRKTGTVIYSSPVQDPASNLRDIKLQFDNSDSGIILGTQAMLVLSEPQEPNRR